MNAKSVKVLAAGVVALLAVLMFMETGNDRESGNNGDLLLPDFRDSANAISEITVQRADYDGPVTMRKSNQSWTVTERDDFPADISKVQQLIRTLANARIVETKTANPDQHPQLGLESPDAEDSQGTLVSLSGENVDYQVIFGNVARTSLRYIRMADENQAWLIDQNPDLPDNAGAWLRTTIVDFAEADVAGVDISHSDGEAISIAKSEEDSNFILADIPDGRELNFPTAANSVAGALSNLTFDDLRPAKALAAVTETTFMMASGLVLTVSSSDDEDGNWISVVAARAADSDGDLQPQIDEINSNLQAWQFQLPEYKFNLINRRMSDFLKPLPDDE